MKNLLHEIHRRSIWQVLGIYIVGSWIALQVVDVLANNFNLPEWFPAFALGLLVLGLPIVLATAFVQEGVGTRESAAPAEADPPTQALAAGSPGLFTWRNAIGGGIAAFALLGVVAAGWVLFGPGLGGRAAASEAEAADLRSIAALPFTTVHTDEESLAFVAGIHDDLLTQLSKIDSLKVISRTSVMQYDGTTKTIPEIADELGVATVLEGGVQKAGTRVRVNVQLIDADTDEHLWAETYDEELTAANVFAIQSDLAEKIAGALRATLTPEVKQRIEAQPTQNLEAYDLYTRGRYIREGPRGTGVQGAQEAHALFLQATALDTAFAQAWAQLATSYLRLHALTVLPESEAIPGARDAANRSLVLDPDLAEAHVARGQLALWESDLETAQSELRKAIALNPGLGFAHQRYATVLTSVGNMEEALREARLAVELDPLVVGYRYTLADALYWAREWDEALEQSRRILEMEPDDAYGYYNLGYALAMKGLNEDAVTALERSVELEPDNPFRLLGLAWAYARAGRADEARATLSGLKDDPGLYAEFAIVYGALGEFDTAFEYLEWTAAEAPARLALLRFDASADPLRSDPRYDELLARAGLETN